MAFDRETAQKLKFRERDVAPFFAGRKSEIAAFEEALETSKESTQAIFRIYQGPPGCGKTSLADYLSRTSSDSLLFTQFSKSDDFDKESLAVAIEEALSADNTPFALAKDVTVFALSLFSKDKAAEIVKERTVRDVPKSKHIVIHIDEAHAMNEAFDDFIETLHTKGVGWPCVVLLTGLNHTKRRIVSIKGMSRLEEEGATMNMGELSHEECVESTMNMLGTISAEGCREAAAHRVATLSFGWPRHLNRAQKALRDELLLEQVDGNLDRADFDQIKRKSDQSRTRYYDSRLNDPLLSRNKALSLHMLDALRAQGTCPNILELGGLCAQAIESYPQVGPFTIAAKEGLDFAEAFIEKGIVVEAEQGFGIAIPSMGDWAHERCVRKPELRD